MAERTRPIRIEFCVTEQERQLIQSKMAQLGTKNMGAYLRKMAIDGYIIKVDYTQQKKLAAAVSRVASNAYLKTLMRPELLILDDLGAERNTSFGRERVFDVVNKRLLTGKPMIVTTNIPLSVMQKTSDLDERRIYDRVLEVCVPVQFNGENFRKGNAAENVKRAARILNQEN